MWLFSINGEAHNYSYRIKKDIVKFFKVDKHQYQFDWNILNWIRIKNDICEYLLFLSDIMYHPYSLIYALTRDIIFP